MANDNENIQEKGCQKKHSHSQGSNSVNTTCMDVKNKNKEMYWGNTNRNAPTATARSVHSVPIVSHSPTLQDIPEESEEYSEDDGTGVSSINSLSRSSVHGRMKYRPVLSTHVVFESNLRAKDTSSTNLSKPPSKSDNTEDSEKAIDLLDKEFTEMLFLQFQVLKKALLEAKEQKQFVESKLELSRKENDSLSEKIINFQKQEEIMIADRRDLSTQLVAAREKVAQSQLRQRCIKENSDLHQQSHKLQDENFTLKKENELMKCKLENCQSTIRKMMEDITSLKKDEKIHKMKGEEAEKEINRLVIELAVWKQKAKSKRVENSSATSSFISDQVDNDSNLLPERKLKPTTSYVEIISSTATPKPPTTATILYGTVQKNKAITVIKEARNAADNSSASPQIKSKNENESQKFSQHKNKGIASLLISESKESVTRRTDTTKTLSDRLSALEGKLQPIMDLVDNLKKSQERMGKELDQKLTHSISLVTTQISSLRSVFEKVQSQVMHATPTTNLASGTPNKSISNIGVQNLDVNKRSSTSKSNIPVSINRKSW